MSILETVLFFIFAFIIVLLLHILIINRGRKTYKEGKKITDEDIAEIDNSQN